MALAAMPAADRRAALFRESLAAKAARWTLGTAWALKPQRVSGLPNLARLCLRELFAPDYALPDPARALPARPHRAAEMVVAAAALAAHVQELPHLEQSGAADAAGPLHRHLRSRLRRRDRGLRRPPRGPLAA